MSDALMLDPILDLKAAASLQAAILAHRGQALELDASAVQRLGAQCLQVLLSAQISGHFRLDPLRERAEALTLRTAELLIDAHMRVEEAEGVVRAVGFARRGEKWAPRSHRADEEALFGPAIRQAG